MTDKIKSNEGFTIVELLIVIVIIGILAAITIVSYTGITARANTAAGQSNAKGILGKVNVYYADGPTNNWPASYGSLTGAATNATYALSGADFTILSGDVSGDLTTKTLAQYKIANNPTDAVDYAICGTDTAAVATSYSTVNNITGIKLGYWDYGKATPAEDWTYVAGSVSGNATNGQAIRCYKVGIAESVAAVAKAIYKDGGNVNYPATVAAINGANANNAIVSAKLPTGVVVSNTTNPGNTTTGANNGLQYVKYECYSTAATCTGSILGGRITYYDWQTSGVATITVGATAGGTYYAPSS